MTEMSDDSWQQSIDGVTKGLEDLKKTVTDLSSRVKDNTDQINKNLALWRILGIFGGIVLTAWTVLLTVGLTEYLSQQKDLSSITATTKANTETLNRHAGSLEEIRKDIYRINAKMDTIVTLASGGTDPFQVHPFDKEQFKAQTAIKSPKENMMVDRDHEVVAKVPMAPKGWRFYPAVRSVKKPWLGWFINNPTKPFNDGTVVTHGLFGANRDGHGEKFELVILASKEEMKPGRLDQPIDEFPHTKSITVIRRSEHLWDRGTPTSINAQIHAPEDGQKVPMTFNMAGNVSDRNAEIWIVARHANDKDTWWVVSRADVFEDKSWKAKVKLAHPDTKVNDEFMVRILINPKATLKKGMKIYHDLPDASVQSPEIKIVIIDE